MGDHKRKHQCMQCGASSEDRVLLVCEEKGQDTYVCVRCLPILIHGAH